jgi:predicted MFS family arabinose efflux permease
VSEQRQSQPAPTTTPAGTAPEGPRRRPLLLRREFGLVWAGSFVSDTGDWLLMIALPLFAFAVTGSALGASTVFLAELVPMLLLGSLLGVVVDRWDHRRTMVIANLLQAVVLLPLLAASAERMWIVYVVAAVEACLAAVVNPAKQALVPRLVEQDELGSGNAFMAVAENLARLIGSPLGGLAFAIVGLPGVVLVDAASYLVSAALIAASRPAGAPHPLRGAADAHPLARRHLLREWVEGLRLIRRMRPLAAATCITALGEVAQGIFLVLFIVYATQELGYGDAGVGLLRGVQAIGGVIGGVLTGVLIRRFAPGTLVGVGYLLFGVISLLTWNLAPVTTALGVYVGLFIVVGIPGVATSTGMITIVQRTAPPEAMGRVVAAVTTVAGAAQGVGLLAAGLLVEHVDVVAVLNGQASLYLACGVLGLLLLGERRRA